MAVTWSEGPDYRLNSLMRDIQEAAHPSVGAERGGAVVEDNHLAGICPQTSGPSGRALSIRPNYTCCTDAKWTM